MMLSRSVLPARERTASPWQGPTHARPGLSVRASFPSVPLSGRMRCRSFLSFGVVTVFEAVEESLQACPDLASLAFIVPNAFCQFFVGTFHAFQAQLERLGAGLGGRGLRLWNVQSIPVHRGSDRK